MLCLLIQDVNTDNGSSVAPDQHQDCQNFEFKEDPEVGGVTFTFERQFDTCHDNEDYVIEVGSQSTLRSTYTVVGTI